jgi:hypothetical protein
MTDEKRSYILFEARDAGTVKGQALAECLQTAEQEPDVQVVKVSGDPSRPERLLVQASEKFIRSLASRFGNRVHAEEDRPLKFSS